VQYSDTVWVRDTDMIRSYADKISIFQMLLMDCEGNPVLSIKHQRQVIENLELDVAVHELTWLVITSICQILFPPAVLVSD
jgi:hypothetical protein